MIPLTIKDVYKFLMNNQYNAQLQSATNQILILFNVDKRDFPFFIKMDEQNHTLSLILFMPCSMRPKAPVEVARLLHLLNKEIDLPGFGMDETANVIFYRYVLLLPAQEIDGTLLKTVIDSLARLGPSFYPLISSVANGVYFEAVASEARKLLQQSIKK